MFSCYIALEEFRLLELIYIGYSFLAEYHTNYSFKAHMFVRSWLLVFSLFYLSSTETKTK